MFSRAPRCQRKRCTHRVRSVGMISVTTVHSDGEMMSVQGRVCVDNHDDVVVALGGQDTRQNLIQGAGLLLGLLRRDLSPGQGQVRSDR